MDLSIENTASGASSILEENHTHIKGDPKTEESVADDSPRKSMKTKAEDEGQPSKRICVEGIDDLPRKSTKTKAEDEGQPSKRIYVEDDLPRKSRKTKAEDEGQPAKRICVEGIGAVVASHYNKIEEKGIENRKSSTIFFMRNFNNWIKSILIDQFVTKTRKNNYGDFSVLDLGCGKGGDILKWKKNFVEHVIFVDIAESSLTQCRDRYTTPRNRDHSKFSAEFIVADFSKTRLKPHLANKEKKVDFVSCQFAIHYAFESLAQAEQLVQNVSENLRSGGHFIATLPNAYKIMAASQKKAERSGENGTSSTRADFGNDIFRISFPKEDAPPNPPLFGDKYNFHLEGVVDCPEFLVHLPTMVRICQKYDLECVYVEDFEDIYHKYKDDKLYRQLMHRMNCLEEYPKQGGQQDSAAYPSAERHLARSGERSVLTLSSSEWEAACLYLALGFRKK